MKAMKAIASVTDPTHGSPITSEALSSSVQRLRQNDFTRTLKSLHLVERCAKSSRQISQKRSIRKQLSMKKTCHDFVWIMTLRCFDFLLDTANARRGAVYQWSEINVSCLKVKYFESFWFESCWIYSLDVLTFQIIATCLVYSCFNYLMKSISFARDDKGNWLQKATEGPLARNSLIDSPAVGVWFKVPLLQSEHLFFPKHLDRCRRRFLAPAAHGTFSPASSWSGKGDRNHLQHRKSIHKWKPLGLWISCSRSVCWHCDIRPCMYSVSGLLSNEQLSV